MILQTAFILNASALAIGLILFKLFPELVGTLLSPGAGFPVGTPGADILDVKCEHTGLSVQVAPWPRPWLPPVEGSGENTTK